MVNMAVSQAELFQVVRIAERAICCFGSSISDRHSLEMDLCATHVNGCSLDLEKLLKAKTPNFGHDIFGIMDNVDRTTGELKNCFVPRCAK